MRRLSAWFLAVAILTAGPAVAEGEAVAWTTSEDGEGDLRRGAFQVADGPCAFHTMADPGAMTVALKHLEGYQLHEGTGTFQDVTLVERFWAVGLVESRYHRTLDAPKLRIEWRLIEGRQARHDGFWTVSPRPDGRADVVFENVIEAKSFLHRGLLKAIQVRTMGAIAEAVIARCGA